MLRNLLLIAVVLFVGVSVDVYAQDARTQELVAALDKTKYKKKEKKNISFEFFMDIKNEAVVRTPSEYSGSYDCGDGSNVLSLQVENNGAVNGTGFDSHGDDRRQSFTLKNASISGALLTGTKVYENGEQRPFEAVFVNRTTRTGKNPETIESTDTKFGLGFIENKTTVDDGSGKAMNYTNRIFLVRR